MSDILDPIPTIITGTHMGHWQSTTLTRELTKSLLTTIETHDGWVYNDGEPRVGVDFVNLKEKGELTPETAQAMERLLESLDVVHGLQVRTETILYVENGRLTWFVDHVEVAYWQIAAAKHSRALS